MNALTKAIEICHGQTALAVELGGKAQLVNNWLRRGGLVPDEHCPGVEKATGGKVPCEELRPDLFWVRVPDPAWPHPGGRPLVDHSVKVAA